MKNNCFGNWIFEDVDCMTCKNETECKIKKERKERDYNKERKIKQYPQCKECNNLLTYDVHQVCKEKPKRCLGKIQDTCNIFRCKCYEYCLKQEWNNYTFEIFTVIKNVNCSQYSLYNKIILKKGDLIRGKKIGKFLYIEYDNGEYKEIEKIFDLEQDIWKKYLVKVMN